MTSIVPNDEAQYVSDLIGAIYDCVVEPSRWDATLAALRDVLDCANAILYVADPVTGDHRMQRMVGIPAAWAARLPEHDADLAALHASVPDFYTRPLDEPFVCHKDVDRDAWRANGYYRDWAAPQGIVDVIDTILIRRPDRVASCALCRHERHGLIGEREIRLSRILAPHLRRAVGISDLIDLTSFNLDALAGALDAVAVGILLVDAESRIVHANLPAQRMLRTGSPLSVLRGRLRAGDHETTARLGRVVAQAARDESEIAAAGIGMVLARDGGTVATAHVLPLVGSAVRRQMLPRAVAAVFVSDGTCAPSGVLEAFAEAYGLTRSEVRLLGRLMLGESIAEAAASLNIARTTVKTHISRLLAKTGSRRQTDLLALVNRLTPAVEPSRGRHRATTAGSHVADF